MASRPIARLSATATSAPTGPSAGTGYPWQDGDFLYAADLNAAIALNIVPPGSTVTAPFSVLTGGGDMIISDVIAVPSPSGGIYMTPNGTNVALCPGANFGCAPPATFNTQTAFIFDTQGAANQQESGVFVLMNANTGADKLWTVNTTYAIGDYAESSGNIYHARTGGVSAASGTGPSGTGTGIVDGACVWDYAGPGYANSKNALNVNAITGSNAGQSWAIAVSQQIHPGWNGRFAAGAEIDISNFSGRDVDLGTGTTLTCLFLSGPVGSHPITTYMQIGPGPVLDMTSGGFASDYGIWLSGTKGYKHHEIFINSTGSETGYFDSGSHTAAGINDGSTSPTGLLLNGTYSAYAINAVGGKFAVSGTGALSMTVAPTVVIPAAGNLTVFVSGATGVGNISTNGTTTAYNTTSDYRLKTLTSEIATGALIDSLKVHIGTFNAIPDAAPRAMLLAHEVQEYMPHVIQGEKDAVDDDGKPVMQMIDHSALIPELIAKCQQLSREVAELRAMIAP